MRIFFRSRFSNKKILGNSLYKHKNLGTDWEGIRPYTPSHDARHIFWKKSTHFSHFFEKTFEEHSQISLILVHIQNENDFFSDAQSPSRHNWKKKSIQTISENAKIANISCKILRYPDEKKFLKDFFKHHFSQQMIIIFGEIACEKYEKFFKKISPQNEIIWIWNYHTFEKNPHKNLLIEWKVFDEKSLNKYLHDIFLYENFLKKFFTKHQIAFLPSDTHSDISLILNNFFKNYGK